ncbi:MAG: hypothetical protein ACKVOG_07140 [Rhodoglobus sp.]
MFLAHELPGLGLHPRTVSRGLERRELVRVKRGAYCAAEVWRSATDPERHRMRVTAAAAAHPHAVFSHWSAAAVLGLPLIGRWPSTVHVAADRATGGRSEVGVTRHCRGLRDEEVVGVGTLRVTSIERTLVDLAVTQPFRFALSPADHALREKLTSKDALMEYLDEPVRGRPRALRVCELADGRAETPGESLSRGTIHQLGFPPPELQVRHVTGTIVEFTDFEWQEFRVIGEFDGLGKYLRDEFRAGRTVAEVVIDEKRREDRLRRSSGSSFARWGWDDALRMTPLRDILLESGLPIVRAGFTDIPG